MKWRAYRAGIWFHSALSLNIRSSCVEYLLIFTKEKIPIQVILGWNQRSSEMPSISWIVRARSLRGRTSTTANAPCRCVFIDHFRCVWTTCIIHEDSALRVNSAKQVALSPEKRGPPRTEGDRVRCDALLTLTSNRQSVILGLNKNSLQTLQIKI